MDKNRKVQQKRPETNGNSSKKRRTRIPDKPDIHLNLWSIIKSFIGKDLTKTALPVNFNEPISMLQKSAEDYEYSELIDSASKFSDIAEQMAYVAAFSMSTYSTTSERIAKPFNPMLGETYECDRIDDMGWKLISEQVCHHPPILAQFCDSKNGWKCSQEFSLQSSFTGKHISAIPMGYSRIEFPSTGTSYSFNRPVTSVHNLIIGKLYIEQTGLVTVTGEGKADGWKCVLDYQSHSFFTKGTRKVKGNVVDPSGNVHITLSARWDDKMEMTKGNKGQPTVIWRKRPPPADSHLYYNFTVFASQLNEPEGDVAPTDSRNRPDQRLMENGDWDESNREKFRLEEKQRARRRLSQDVEPIWFSRCKDEITGNAVYKYTGDYWKCKSSGDWSKCPAIF